MKLSYLATAMLALLVTSAQADQRFSYDYEPTPLEEVSVSDLYFGGSYGTAKSHEVSNNENAWQAFTGVTLWRTIGIEAGYADLGQHVVFGNIADATSTYARLPINLPIVEKLYFSGNAGWNLWDANSVASTIQDSDGNDRTFGAGLHYRFDHNMIARVGLQRFYLADEYIDLATVGIAVYF